LAFYLHFFIFRESNLPRSSVAIDLRKPTDLSGIPAKIGWISNSWPPPKIVVPLAASGSSCEAAGNVNLSLVLPDGYVLQDTATRVVVETDNRGVWQVYIEAFGVKPEAALANIEHDIWPLASRPENQENTAKERTEIQDRLENFDSKTPLDMGFEMRYPSYSLQLGIRNISALNPITFSPTNRVLYVYTVTLPRSGR
jgi:hypothetical protein